jgi:hypothetical protein
VTAYADQCTRVYLMSGMRAHLLPPGKRIRDSSALALCGLSTWPTYWRGTGDYGERQQAAAMTLCQTCEKKMIANSGGQG